jgi:4-amino-4-deoxy-L-arabinose transferase-like glycosyltransferase
MSGFRFYEKPPLVYWMTAASIEAFGHTAFAIRLPAALCGGLAALAVGVAARRGARMAGTAPGDATVIGALVSLASLTMVLPAVGSSVAILDQPIAGLTLAASCSFFMAVTGPEGRTLRVARRERRVRGACVHDEGPAGRGVPRRNAGAVARVGTQVA